MAKTDTRKDVGTVGQPSAPLSGAETQAREAAQRTIAVRRRNRTLIIIATTLGVVVILVVLGALILASRPSETEQAFNTTQKAENAALNAGLRADQKAKQEAFNAAKAIEKAPISPEAANFTPGLYQQANLRAIDGADVVASFLILVLTGKVDEAIRFVQDPKEPSIVKTISLFSGKGAVPIRVSALSDSSIAEAVTGDSKVKEGARIREGHEYYTFVSKDPKTAVGYEVYLKRTPDGTWVITRLDGLGD